MYSSLGINLSNVSGFATHRSGWQYALRSLLPLHSSSGIYLDDFIERSFSWNLHEFYKGDNPHKIPYKNDWIGIWHNPPNMPDWYDSIHSPREILKRDLFQESLKHCKCIIVLSEYMKSYLDNMKNFCDGLYDIPIVSVKHPTEYKVKQWSISNFLENKEVIQIGYWLRNINSFKELIVPDSYRKLWLPSTKAIIKYYIDYEEKTNKYTNKWLNISDRLDDNEYDNKLASSIGFIDFYDSSANNGVIEAIARSMPILVNRIPATEEYLGKGYPFFFEDLKDASRKILDNDLIYETHLYLKYMNKEWLKGSYFRQDLYNKLRNVL